MPEVLPWIIGATTVYGALNQPKTPQPPSVADIAAQSEQMAAKDRELRIKAAEEFLQATEPESERVFQELLEKKIGRAAGRGMLFSGYQEQAETELEARRQEAMEKMRTSLAMGNLEAYDAAKQNYMSMLADIQGQKYMLETGQRQAQMTGLGQISESLGYMYPDVFKDIWRKQQTKAQMYPVTVPPSYGGALAGLLPYGGSAIGGALGGLYGGGGVGGGTLGGALGGAAGVGYTGGMF